MRWRGLGVGLAMTLWLLGGLNAQAADQLDQSQPFYSGQQALRNPMAQTFTAGATGAVDRVSLMLSTTTGASAATVQLQTVSGGKPSGTVLGSSSYTGAVACCHQWHAFVFSPAVGVAAGTQYAIVVRPTGTLTWYALFGSDNYPAGQLWLASGSSWLGGAQFGYDFTFQTYLTTGATNHPPVVSAASGSVSAGEGSTVTNSGTFSDPDGDPVTLTASQGTVSHTGSSSGTWTWSLPGTDEQGAQTVTVTATDSHGSTSTATFTYTVVAVAPTVTITGAPASGPEGTSLTLTASASSPSAADNSAGFTFVWTVTKDGNAFATGSGQAFAFTPDDEGSFAASVQVTDDGGAAGSASATIAGSNVAPSVAISGVVHDTLVLVPAQALTFTGGFTDPGKLDTHVATLDWGDGSGTDSYSYAAGVTGDVTDTHAYAAPGSYTVSYSVSDDDGGSGTVSVKVTVESPAQALGVIGGYLATMQSLNKGEKQGLSAKLDAATASLNRGDTTPACNQLDAFLNDLVALTNNGRLSAGDSAALSSSVWVVHRALGCTKVKVAWLSLTL